MLPTADSFKSSLLSLSPTTVLPTGVAVFVGALADFMNQVQATGGTPGIFTFNNAIMISLLLPMPLAPDSSWIPGFVSAWTTAVTASIITPGTVSNPVWIGSGGFDAVTLPLAAATILTIPAAATLLTTGLGAVPTSNDQTLAFATAIRNATLGFVFTCIGLGPPPPLTPIPLPLAAQ